LAPGVFWCSSYSMFWILESLGYLPYNGLTSNWRMWVMFSEVHHSVNLTTLLFSNLGSKKKIWCASRARVNLTILVIEGILLNLFYNKTQVSPFLHGICMRIPLSMSNFYILSSYVMLLDPKPITKSAASFVLEWDLLNQTQVLTFLSRNL
jgi:hypothetical protein